MLETEPWPCFQPPVVTREQERGTAANAALLSVVLYIKVSNQTFQQPVGGQCINHYQTAFSILAELSLLDYTLRAGKRT